MCGNDSSSDARLKTKAQASPTKNPKIIDPIEIKTNFVNA